jgi:hypothetical protein
MAGASNISPEAIPMAEGISKFINVFDIITHQHHLAT